MLIQDLGQQRAQNNLFGAMRGSNLLLQYLSTNINNKDYTW